MQAAGFVAHSPYEVFCAERVYLGILDALTEVSESEREKENIL